MARAAVASFLLVASCAHEPAGGADAGADLLDGSAAWAPTVATATSAMEVEAPTTPDPGALDRILSKVPSAQPSPTDPDGGTRVGRDTGEPGEELPRSGNQARARRPEVQAGPIEIQPQISSPSLERAAREQIYWALRKCVDADGKPPPPESITLAFTIRADGSVDPASVNASADDKSLEPVAECVLREFSSLPFRGPFAARRTSARVLITWPSVD